METTAKAPNLAVYPTFDIKWGLGFTECGFSWW